MAQLITWDAVASRLFETGVDHAVLYPQISDGTYPKGVAWNGLVSVTESPSGGEANPQYADNIKYLNLISAEDFGGTIEAFMYPDEFAILDGSVEQKPGVMIGQQVRKAFGLAYRTLLGNDVDGTSYGYKLHLLYGCMVSPSEKAYNSVSDSPEAITFSWEFTTTPAPVTGLKPVACITINSKQVDAPGLADLEEALYGTTGTPDVDGFLPTPDAVLAMFAAS